MNLIDADDRRIAQARRILVIGCSGSGKSTLSRALSEKLGLPYISMDREFFWLPGWRLRDRNEIRIMIAEAVAGEGWIMDGSSPRTLDLRLPRADLVIWLRMPRALCLWRIIQRRIRHHGRVRPEMAEGCPEKIDLEFLRYVWNFEKTQTPKIVEAIERHGPDVPVVTLHRPVQADELVARIEAAV